MTAIFMIVLGSVLLFVLLAFLIKKPGGSHRQPVAVVLKPCAICQEKFPESELVTRTIGDANYKRSFCDRCITELYEESRLLHDPLYKASDSEDA